MWSFNQKKKKKKMKLEEAREQARVAYIPKHAGNDINHEDVEFGRISSKNKKFVFVKFDKSVQRIGWGETTAEACYPEDLIYV